MKPSPPDLPEDVANGAPAKPLTLHLDMEKYLGQLEDWEISQDQKREFTATLWHLLRSFAELGFDIHPVQQAQKSCGKLSKNHSKAALTGPDALYSSGKKPTKIKTDFGASGASETKEIRS